MLISIVLFLFAGFIALTQESDSFTTATLPTIELYETGEIDEYTDNLFARITPEWVKSEHWFRSNAGGMALEEIPSRYAALRNEYALVIDFADAEELPEYMLPYYDDSYFIETRKLFESGEESRTQWIFRDTNGTTRLIAAFSREADVENKINEIDAETNNEELTANGEKKYRNGFIEIFNENAAIITDFRFYDDGVMQKTEYRYRDGFFISAHSFLWVENEEDDGEGEFAETYADFFRYNRSSFLRSVERVFYRETQISHTNDPILVAFPHNIMENARNDFFISEKLNSYPEFFGDVTADENNRLSSTADGRGRILTQTFYDEEDNIIWFITNTWHDDRIVSVSKTEGGVEFLAEYEYNSNGDRILERNFKDGVLERVVITEGNRDTESLYMNNIVVLQAVWEDGRKISETRVRN